MLQLSLRILTLFLKGVRSGRTSWTFITPSRVPVICFWATVLLFIVFLPLIIASAFGGFRTPLDHIVLLVTAALALSTLPLLVNIAAGSLILWQRAIVLGQWVRVCGHDGEVVELSLFKMTIVPKDGGRVSIPMTLLLFNAFSEVQVALRSEFRVQLVRVEGLEVSQKKLKGLFSPELEIDIICRSICAHTYHFSILTAKFHSEVRTRILATLSEAHEKGEIQLTDTPVEEVSH